MDNDPERSILEIKHLLSRLNPRGAGGGHKDRVRVLSRFRNYVAGAGAQKKGQKVRSDGCRSLGVGYWVLGDRYDR